jgi:plasmid stabilization system protein ParE
MSRALVFLPEVRRDFIEGFNYYDAFSPGRGGARFEAAFKRSLQQVEAGVIKHFRVFDHFYRVQIHRFPYILYYRLIEPRAVIVGVLYARFDPLRIAAILKART